MTSASTFFPITICLSDKLVVETLVDGDRIVEQGVSTHFITKQLLDVGETLGVRSAS